MSEEHHKPAPAPYMCNGLRQASRAVSRLYDEELRAVGLRTTQCSLLCHLRRAGEVRQRNLGGLTSLDETTLTRNLRSLIDSGWVAIGTGLPSEIKETRGSQNAEGSIRAFIEIESRRKDPIQVQHMFGDEFRL
jgi:hypothetical protein